MQPIEKILGKIQQLPSLPTLVMEIMDSFNNDKADIASLVGKIRQDPALTMKVIRMANSPFFGFSRQIGSIQEAVMVIGFNSLRGLVIAAALVNQFPLAEKAFQGKSFWNHSIGTGGCAKALARRSGADAEIAFTTGLLHDIGRLMLGVYFYDEFLLVLEYRQNKGVSMIEAERAVLGLDHAALGAEVAKRWNFPQDIQAAIRDHHNQSQAQGAMLTDIVHIADLLSHALASGETPKAVLARSAEGLLRLGIDETALDSMAAELGQINSSMHMLL